ncbi:unnamed protein product [Periconia digitata]|uniref:Uncharacterized protein n=1 Tax=Periconia digitata TaxID=1303443 RepID=A0A9W4UJW9_9PLEO|nr:unnamed protein product [Periconia digitata]
MRILSRNDLSEVSKTQARFHPHPTTHRTLGHTCSLLVHGRFQKAHTKSPCIHVHKDPSTEIPYSQ